jgi:hypothetical protein
MKYFIVNNSLKQARTYANLQAQDENWDPAYL